MAAAARPFRPRGAAQVRPVRLVLPAGRAFPRRLVTTAQVTAVQFTAVQVTVALVALIRAVAVSPAAAVFCRVAVHG